MEDSYGTEAGVRTRATAGDTDATYKADISEARLALYQEIKAKLATLLQQSAADKLGLLLKPGVEIKQGVAVKSKAALKPKARALAGDKTIDYNALYEAIRGALLAAIVSEPAIKSGTVLKPDATAWHDPKTSSFLYQHLYGIKPEGLEQKSKAAIKTKSATRAVSREDTSKARLEALYHQATSQTRRPLFKPGPAIKPGKPIKPLVKPAIKPGTAPKPVAIPWHIPRDLDLIFLLKQASKSAIKSGVSTRSVSGDRAKAYKKVSKKKKYPKKKSI